MNENDEDLELAALQRQLDDAFETTRPRPGFDDELWLRMQSSRPASSRLRDALSGLVGGIRAVPTVPLAAAAAFLVIALLVGLVARFGAGGGSTATSSFGGAARAPGQFYAGSFGKLPTPVFNGQKSTAPTGDNGQQSPIPAYSGPVQFTWSGKLTLNIVPAAPVYRYREPSPAMADQFATGLGAVLRDRPSGFLGTYTAADYTLQVRGTIGSPPSSPAYFIFASLTMPPTDAAGAGPADQANIFLAQHSLVPQWSNTVEVDSSGDPIKVRYDRQFDVGGYGHAYLVDSNGNREGLEVDLSANRPVLAMGPLPVSLDSADYKVISGDDAVRSAVGTSSTGAAGAAPVPTVQLDKAEVVYVLASAGDYSFYEPAYLFSGTLKLKDQTLTERVLVPAVDPSQRNP